MGLLCNAVGAATVMVVGCVEGGEEEKAAGRVGDWLARAVVRENTPLLVFN